MSFSTKKNLILTRADELTSKLPGSFGSALDGVRVLDLTEERGMYAGKMLAELGADVLLVEKPGGSKARQIGPFKNDVPGLENSLYFLNFNAGKKSVTLDIDIPEGRKIFKRLVKGADVVIEDAEVGRMQAIGLDYKGIRRLNRGIILACLTGFGLSGPYSRYKSPDIVSFAMGGLMNVNGPENAAPVVAPFQQSYYSTSAAAVFSILAALFLRISTGEGQVIDTSAHEVGATFSGEVMAYSNTSEIAKRSGSQFSISPGRVYPCADGHIHILIIRPNHWLAFLEILGNPNALMGEQWRDVSFRNRNVDLIDAHIIEFTAVRNKTEIAELFQKKGIPCTPVNSPEDFYLDPHIREREFFKRGEHPIIGTYLFPRSPLRLSMTPAHPEYSAPILGQHNGEIYCGELGYEANNLEALKAKRVI